MELVGCRSAVWFRAVPVIEAVVDRKIGAAISSSRRSVRLDIVYACLALKGLKGRKRSVIESLWET